MDRLTKWWAISRLRGKGSIEILPGFFRFFYIENKGAAFGLLGQHAILLILLTSVAIIGMIIFLLTKKNIPKLIQTALWLVVGGALGNLVDRIFLGYVVDFMEIRVFIFPVFNVADCCVSVSVAFLVGWILLHKEALPSAE